MADAVARFRAWADARGVRWAPALQLREDPDAASGRGRYLAVADAVDADTPLVSVPRVRPAAPGRPRWIRARPLTTTPADLAPPCARCPTARGAHRGQRGRGRCGRRPPARAGGARRPGRAACRRAAAPRPRPPRGAGGGRGAGAVARPVAGGLRHASLLRRRGRAGARGDAAGRGHGGQARQARRRVGGAARPARRGAGGHRGRRGSRPGRLHAGAVDVGGRRLPLAGVRGAL